MLLFGHSKWMNCFCKGMCIRGLVGWKRYRTYPFGPPISFRVHKAYSVCRDQCDQIGRFWKLLVTKFLSKVAQIIGNFLGYFEKSHSFVKNYAATSWVTFGNFWATFYSNIWSHWPWFTSWFTIWSVLFLIPSTKESAPRFSQRKVHRFSLNGIEQNRCWK